VNGERKESVGERKWIGWLLRLARTRRMGRCIRWVFEHMSFAIPVKRLRETDTLLAFHHPNPAYSVHILIVPKRAWGSLLELESNDSAFLRDLIETVQILVRDLGLDAGSYRLIANGGGFQDVAQLHFHLVSGTPPAVR
jgi:histidine triad (HIT) family protein